MLGGYEPGPLSSQLCVIHKVSRGVMYDAQVLCDNAHAYFNAARRVTLAVQVVGCNGAVMGMLPWLFGAFLADFRAIPWSWLQLPLAVAAILVHLVTAILQVRTATDTCGAHP